MVRCIWNVNPDFVLFSKAMKQSHGIFVFGFCFFVFLAWLWRYPNYPATVPATVDRTEVDEWLAANDLDSFKDHFRSSGML